MFEVENTLESVERQSHFDQTKKARLTNAIGEAAVAPLQRQERIREMSITFAASDAQSWPRIRSALDSLGASYSVLNVEGFGRPRLFFGAEEVVGEDEILQTLPRLENYLNA